MCAQEVEVTTTEVGLGVDMAKVAAVDENERRTVETKTELTTLVLQQLGARMLAMARMLLPQLATGTMRSTRNKPL